MTFLTFSIKCCLLSLIGDTNEGTDQQDEISGKKGKRGRKKNVEVEEAVGKKCQRLHAVNNLLTL